MAFQVFRSTWRYCLARVVHRGPLSFQEHGGSFVQNVELCSYEVIAVDDLRCLGHLDPNFYSYPKLLLCLEHETIVTAQANNPDTDGEPFD